MAGCEPLKASRIYEIHRTYLANELNDFKVLEICKIPWWLCKHEVSCEHRHSRTIQLMNSILPCKSVQIILNFGKTTATKRRTHLKQIMRNESKCGNPENIKERQQHGSPFIYLEITKACRLQLYSTYLVAYHCHPTHRRVSSLQYGSSQ